MLYVSVTVRDAVGLDDIISTVNAMVTCPCRIAVLGCQCLDYMHKSSWGEVYTPAVLQHVYVFSLFTAAY